MAKLVPHPDASQWFRCVECLKSVSSEEHSCELANHVVSAEEEVKAFLRKGGVIQVEKSQKTPKTFMSAKSSRGYLGGTSGFAIGFPRKIVGVN